MIATVQPTERDRQRQKQAAARAAEKDILPPKIGNLKRRLKYEADDAAWLAFYMGHVYTHPLTADRLENILQMRYCCQYGVRKCIAAPRGSGKTTDFRYILLKDALSGVLPFAFLVSASSDKATESENAIRDTLEGAMPGTPLFDDYPFECMVIQEVARSPGRQRSVTVGGMDVHVRWSHNAPIVFPSIRDYEADPKELWDRWRIVPNKLGTILSSCGITSSRLQGSNVLNVRPTIIGIDDVDDRESSETESVRMAEKIQTIIDQTIAGMGGQDRPMGQVMLCTVPSRNSVAFIYSDPQKKPAWDGVRIPRLKAWPDRMDLWEKYIDLKHRGIQELGDDKRPVDKFGRNAHGFYLENRKAMDSGAVVYDPCDFKSLELPDGTPKQVSAIQACFDYIADNGRESFDTEHQQTPPNKNEAFETKVTAYHVANCAGDYDRLSLDPTTTMVVRGVDVRKIELHQVTMTEESSLRHRIVDYDVRSHGTSETTVEQSEALILQALRDMADDWNENPLIDLNGIHHSTDLTLVDKGWLGNWKTEDGTIKTWARQPVEQFCVERGLRNWLPAKGAPDYRSPKPSRDVLIGDNWHINFGKGQERKCDEVIWSAAHWHMLVEELFMVEDGDADKFELFRSGEGIYTNHKGFGEHITVGATQMKEQLSRGGTRSRKPRFVRDHWWDSAAMMLVAQSVETVLRERQKAKRPKRSLADMAKGAK